MIFIIALYIATNGGEVSCRTSGNGKTKKLQHQHLIRIKMKAISLDSTIVGAHPDGTGV